MTKPWVLTDTHPEGKYLVVRRDGTIPAWPHFVLGGDDPATPAAMRAYADATRATVKGGDTSKPALDTLEYAAGCDTLADMFDQRLADNKRRGDPVGGPHRLDNPAVIQMMRGKGDLSGLGVVPSKDEARHLRAVIGKALALLDDTPIEQFSADVFDDVLLMLREALARPFKVVSDA